MIIAFPPDSDMTKSGPTQTKRERAGPDLKAHVAQQNQGLQRKRFGSCGRATNIWADWGGHDMWRVFSGKSCKIETSLKGHLAMAGTWNLIGESGFDLKSDMLLLLLLMAKMNLDTHPSSLRLKDSSDYLLKTSRKNLLINTCPINCFNICPTSSKKSPSA